jgi:hypothetical protein
MEFIAVREENRIKNAKVRVLAFIVFLSIIEKPNHCKTKERNNDWVFTKTYHKRLL